MTARSIPRGEYVDAIVDNSELIGLGWLSQLQLPDFNTQVQRWLASESHLLTGLSKDSNRQPQGDTLFVMGSVSGISEASS